MSFHLENKRRDLMKTIDLIILAMIIIATADASTVVLEAGPFAIVLDEHLESMDLAGADLLKTLVSNQ
jgi:hypothetical protein